jgi:uncharacterized protein YlxP (DUF503 family)
MKKPRHPEGFFVGKLRSTDGFSIAVCKTRPQDFSVAIYFGIIHICASRLRQVDFSGDGFSFVHPASF